jgi:oxygen-independent coproporphyrinogen-3 oxidase
MEQFGVYFHIPYCLQRCTYCDFATYEKSQILAPENYTNLVLMEMEQRSSFFAPRPLNTIYFGGGTPSLINPDLILQMIRGLEKLGFHRSPDIEITLEINPATLNKKKMESYLKMGINRFSVGAQTFDDTQLKKVKREHSSDQTIETLHFLKTYGVNYSFDLLFALPGQTLEALKRDLDFVLKFNPPHVSPYCLTVPPENPLAHGRPEEEIQVEMFDLISNTLNGAGYQQYEISNFAKIGFESRHNQLYWQDHEWWGLGLSSHSYSKAPDYGVRFWNPRGISDYEQQIREGTQPRSPLDLPKDQFEKLELYQAMTDFCHTSLRMLEGLDLLVAHKKFPEVAAHQINEDCQRLVKRGYLQKTQNGFSLTQEGIVLSNQVFLELTYLKSPH